MDAEYWRLQHPEELGGTPAPSSLIWAIGELVLGANAPVWMYAAGPAFAGVVHRNGNERDKQIAQHMVDRQWGTHHGAHRARRRLRRRRRPRQGRRRTTTAPGTSRASSASSPRREHDMSENIMHLVLARPDGRRGRRRPRHQGPLAVHRAEVPLRPRDRRADRRAQRRLRHQRRAQDGHQGLQHLRGHLRRPAVGGASRPRAGCSARCTTASRRCSRSSRTPG